MFKDQYQRFVCERPDKVSIMRFFIFAFQKELFDTWLMLIKLSLSLPVFTDAAFTCYQNDHE